MAETVLDKKSWPQELANEAETVPDKKQELAPRASQDWSCGLGEYQEITDPVQEKRLLAVMKRSHLSSSLRPPDDHHKEALRRRSWEETMEMTCRS